MRNASRSRSSTAQMRLTLRLGDPSGPAERFHQVIDLAGADPVQPGFHDHCEQGPVDPAAPLQLRWEEAARSQLGDLQFDVTVPRASTGR